MTPITPDEVAALERADRLLGFDGVQGDRGVVAAMILEAVQHEREACAALADEMKWVQPNVMAYLGEDIAKAIRARND